MYNTICYNIKSSSFYLKVRILPRAKAMGSSTYWNRTTPNARDGQLQLYNFNKLVLDLTSFSICFLHF